MKPQEDIMDTYTGFAYVYDEMMSNIPYLQWEAYLLHLLYSSGVKPDASIAELGCGTGTMTELLSDDGFDITGIDLSEDMLSLAREKVSGVTFLQMDMREFTIDKKQDAIISVADSVNYLEDVDDLSKTLKCVYAALKPGGVFIFDLKTEFFYKYIVRNRTFRGRGKGFSYVWKNYYDEDGKFHIYDVLIKRKCVEGKCVDGTHANKKRTVENEIHKQHVFTADEIKNAALFAGFTHATVYGNMTFEKPRKNSDRIYVVLKKEC